MAILFSPVLNEQQFDANGDPLAGGFIYTYLAGTTTPVTTYKTSTGTAHSNPIVLDSAGYYPTGTQLWLDSGKVYKFVVQDSLGATIRTIDDIAPVNDSTDSAATEWITYTTGPATYLSATSFSVVGDQTLTFRIGRRLKTTNTAGTVYSTVTNSVYGAPNTTVTVSNDTGTALDSGLSAVEYGILSPSNPSLASLSANSPEAALAISQSGAGVALKVTQTGSGNAVLIEDVASDTTPFVINASGQVGVGRSTIPTDVNMIIDQAGTSTIPTITNPAGLVVANSAAAGSAANATVIAGATGTASLWLGSSANQVASGISYNNNTSLLIFRTGGANAGLINNANQLIMNGATAATATAGSFITTGRIQSEASFTVTTATAANLVVASDGLFARSTSALKYKTDLQPITEGQIQAYLGMTGYSYVSKADGDDKTIRHFGMVADYAHEAGLRELVNYGKDGEIEGYNYGRDTAILLEIVKRQQATIDNLNTRLSALEEA